MCPAWVSSSSGTASGSMVPRPRFTRGKKRATIAPGIRGPIPGRASRALTMANRFRSHPAFKQREIDALGRSDKVIEKVTMFAAPHETAHGTSRTLGDVRLESAKCAKADMISRYHNRDFMSTRTRLKRAAASSEASAVTCRHREGHCVQAVTCAAGAEASHRLHELAN